MCAANGLGALQFETGDLLAALSSYSRALRAAETILAAEGAQAGAPTREAVAQANRHVGEVLIRNGAPEAGAAKLRKALEIYEQLSLGDRAAELRSQLLK